MNRNDAAEQKGDNMKKTINGKRYDTDKATEIATFDSPHYRTDFHWFCETLYRTARGRFFLHGEGNGLSRYSTSCADGWGPGTRVVPMTEDEALEWCEQTGNEEAIDEYFTVEDA